MPRNLHLLLLIAGTLLRAQYEQASITGTVHDPQGRAVPGAKVQVRQAETGWIRSTISTESGLFTLSALPLGDYILAVSGAGFSDAKLSGIKLSVGQTRSIDVTLSLATQSEQVSISAQLSEIDQASAAVGTRI